MTGGPYRLVFTQTVATAIGELESKTQYIPKLKKVKKALGLLQRDPRYPSLNSHKYTSVKGKNNEEVWDSYVENHTPGAWRIFWHFGPDSKTITVVYIGPHLKD